MNVEDWLIDRIVGSEIRVVAICGAADLGKSYLARQLVAKLRERMIPAVCLGLDSYLIPRDVRAKQGLSGYDPGSHDLDSAKRDVERLLSGQSIEYFEYRHDAGHRSEHAILLEPASHIFIEGLHSMHPSLASLVDFSIYIFTSEAELRRIRREADLKKRKLTNIEANEHEASELESYYRYVHPYKTACNVSIYLDQHWHYHLMQE